MRQPRERGCVALANTVRRQKVSASVVGASLEVYQRGSVYRVGLPLALGQMATLPDESLPSFATARLPVAESTAHVYGESGESFKVFIGLEPP